MKKIKKNEAFLRLLVPDLDAKRNEIDRIASIRFHHFITDMDMLAVAMYASHAAEAAYCIHQSSGSVPQMAAEKAKAFHFDMKLIQKAARNGYFEKNIEKLLALGKSNADYGAKLVQVFWCFMEHIEEHRLSKAIVQKMDAFIMDQGWKHGFIIKHQSKDEVHERFFAGERDVHED